MKSEKTNTCAVCGKEKASTECDHCGKPLCRKCSMLEIWGSGAEDLSAKYFCPACKENPDINPWGAYIREQGSAEIIDLFDRKETVRLAKAA
jgi:hypothetical protein